MAKYNIPNLYIANRDRSGSGGSDPSLVARVAALEEAVADQGSYSATEHEVGTWIDGSALYAKTVDVGQLPSSTSKEVAHGLTNVTIRDLTGVAISSEAAINLPYVGITTNTVLSVVGDNIVINAGSNMSAYSGYVTLKYTKNS